MNVEKARLLFPDITDWTDPQNEKRFDQNFKKMSLKEFFWFTPVCYKLIFYGSDIINIIIFSILALTSYKWIHPLFAIFPLILSLLFIVSVTKKFMKYNLMKDYNMYDHYLKKPEQKQRGN